MIHKNEFLDLATIHKPHCISIYIPTTGKEEDRIKLKNHVQEARKILSKSYDLGPREIDAFLDPLMKYSEEFTFYSQPNSGLALFAYDGKVREMAFTDVAFPSKLYISDHLYLVPLSNLVGHNQRVLLLQLSANKCRLYEAETSSINEHPATAKLPDTIHDVVGHDVEQKSLQYRSGQQDVSGQQESGMYHGHGSGGEIEKKEEYIKYFRYIDEVLNKELRNEDAPLVLACVDYLFPIYQGINTYEHMHPFFLEGNFDDASDQQLHEALQSEEGLSISDMDQGEPTPSEFEGKMSEQLASYHPEEIIPASFEGKIQKLLIKRGATLYGKFDESRNNTEIDELRSVNNASLINVAAIETIKNGGEVAVVDEDEMPAPSTGVNAIYRYNHNE